MFLYMYHHIADELIYHSVMSVYSTVYGNNIHT